MPRKSFCEHIKSKNSFKKLSTDMKVQYNFQLQEYKHTTFKVNSLSDFITVLDIIKSKPGGDYTELFFRGMTNYEWTLMPHLGRHVAPVEFCESEMINEMLTLKPEEFSGITSDFDLLAKMQHYGIPTRLLDFTTNPLVALYFACQKEKRNTTGRVICTYNSCTYNVSKLVELISGLYKISDYTNVYFDDMAKDQMSLLSYAAYKRFPIMIKPKYSNERIKRQSAVFMVFDNILYDKKASIAYLEKSGMNEDEIAYGIQLTAEDKKQIEFIKENENIEEIYPEPNGVNNLFRFCVSSESLNKLYHLYEKEFEQLDINKCEKGNCAIALKKRFSIEPIIAPIEEGIMRNEFCSILIEPKYKEKILQELECLNINEQYLFPELEYTAKNIKKKYFDEY